VAVDELFLLPVPREILAGDDYLDVEAPFRGDDFILVAGDRWDPARYGTASKRREAAFGLTRSHFAALRRVSGPREILVLAHDDRAPSAAKSYADARERWIDRGAVVLPDLVPEMEALLRSTQNTPPLTPQDVRVPFPMGTVRARLRRLESSYAFQEVRARAPRPGEMVGLRAGVVLVDVNSDLSALSVHYRDALRGLGLGLKEDRPSKGMPLEVIQMHGRKDGLDVLVTARKDKTAGTIAVGVLWLERFDSARASASKRAAKKPAGPDERDAPAKSVKSLKKTPSVKSAIAKKKSKAARA
jgi:hypothetical protein